VEKMKFTFSLDDVLKIYAIGVITSLSLILLMNFTIAQDQHGPYPMNMSITTAIAISLSDKLAEGIFYTNDTGAENGTNVQYPVNTQQVENATWNYVTVNRITWYNITNTGTTDEDICGKATTDLMCNPLTTGCGNTEILIANATWSNSTSNDPPYPGPYEWGTSYPGNLAADSLSKDNTIYTRYWLNVPNVPAGTYNTTFTYCAVESGVTCNC